MMKLDRGNYRQIGAVAGLLSGWLAMFAVGYQGLLPAAIFGIGGCVFGGILGEKFHDRH